MKPQFPQDKFVMSVTSKFPSLYEAFKKEVEKLGWVYNSDFTEFTETNCLEQYHDCMFFSSDFFAMRGTPAFSLSNLAWETTVDFVLENDFQSAVTWAKKLIEELKNRKPFVYLKDGYEAEIDYEERTVEVNGEKFDFCAIKNLYNTIYKYD